MKVTMQGERVVADLWDVIAARGFEKEPFFEVAAVEIGSLPKLEGTTHVNMALIVKFLKNYLFNPAEFPEVPRHDELADDTFLFNQGPTKGLGDIRFHDYRLAYSQYDLPNIEVFRQQIERFRHWLIEDGPGKEQVRDIDYMLSVGELFSLVVYGQLILEKARMENTDPALLNQIFDVFVRDFSIYATTLHGKPGNSDAQRTLILQLVQAPVANPQEFDEVWRERVYSLNGAYELAD
jgi:acyl-CoA dehydrogenase